jgi:nuclease S1
MRTLLPIILALVASTAHAWGTQGHHVIANIAQTQFTAKTKAEIDKLLALEPGETLASISTWADEHRNPAMAGRYPKTQSAYDRFGVSKPNACSWSSREFRNAD